MQVILLEKIGRLGSMGDVVQVKNGFARNYLIPQNRALRATKDNKALFESQRAEIEKRNAASRAEAEKAAAKIHGLHISLVRAASEDGKLYGSVTVRDLAEELNAQGHKVERRHILLPATIKMTGAYDFSVALHPEVTAELKVKVVRNESEVAIALSEDERAEDERAEDEQAPAPDEAAADAPGEHPAEGAA